MERKEIFERFKQDPHVSVLIIGAGVNGIGTFRDLAFQNIDVLIVDRGDFCSGASAASSHMIHGGIRYLENGEFRLVKEAVQERNHLLKNAPHYVKPLSTVIPIYKWFSGLFNAPLKFLGIKDKPSERGAIVIKIGLVIYDLFSGGKSRLPRHKFKPKSITLREFTSINPDIIFTAHYQDAAMVSPERICIEMIVDGEFVNQNAHALNYVSIQDTDGTSIRLVDQISQEIISVQPKIVINAAGPWIDIVNKRLNYETKLIGGTKGSHLILDNPELHAAIGGNEFFFENKDGRIVLINPYQDKVMVGSTDIPIDDPDKALCTDDEIDYFFEMVSSIFPAIPVFREQIVYQFSGVRPLPTSDSSITGQISRDHSIVSIEQDSSNHFPIYNLVGGKWTTFRSFSEQITNMCLALLSAKREIDTTELPIGGGQDYPRSPSYVKSWIESHAKNTGLSTERVAKLFERYGTKSTQFIKSLSKRSEKLLLHIPEYSQSEIQFIVTNEKVIHLDDFLLRRSSLAKIGLLSMNAINEIAEIVGKELSWSDHQVQEEIQRSVNILSTRHGVSFH